MKIFVAFKSYLEKRHLWEVFTYLFFGGLTTLVNFVVYFIARDLAGLSMVVANSLAWLLSVVFAFVTNKLWVFYSQTEGLGQLAQELGKFVFYRGLSYILDMGLMILLIDVLHLGDFVSKLITQIVVVVANYLFSKLFIFNKKADVIETSEEHHEE